MRVGHEGVEPPTSSFQGRKYDLIYPRETALWLLDYSNSVENEAAGKPSRLNSIADDVSVQAYLT